MNFISPIQNKKNVKSLQYSVNVKLLPIWKYFILRLTHKQEPQLCFLMETFKKKLKKMRGGNVNDKEEKFLMIELKIEKALAKAQGCIRL